MLTALGLAAGVVLFLALVVLFLAWAMGDSWGQTR
jgi:hypothetical protein